MQLLCRADQLSQMEDNDAQGVTQFSPKNKTAFPGD